MAENNPLKQKETTASGIQNKSDLSLKLDSKEFAELIAAVCNAPAAIICLEDQNGKWNHFDYGKKIGDIEMYLQFSMNIIDSQNTQDIVIVEDIYRDSRIKNHLSGTDESPIQFFASIPIYSTDKKFIGYSYIIDYTPRTLNESQKKAVSILLQKASDIFIKDNGILKEIRQKTSVFAQVNRATDDDFRNIIEQFPAAIIIFQGSELIIDTVNKSMLELLDKNSDIIGLPLLQALPELKDQPAFDLLSNIYLTGETVHGNETQVQLFRNGQVETGYFNFTYAPLYKNNEIIGIIDMAVEVTDQVQAKLKLAQSEEQLKKINQELVLNNDRIVGTNNNLIKTEELLKQVNSELIQKKNEIQSILDAVKEGIGITDNLGNIIYTNERAREILKIDTESILKRKNSSPEWFNRRLDGSSMPHEEHPVSIAIATGKAVYNKTFLVQAEGEDPLYLHMNATPILNAEGIVTGAIGSFSDITQSYLLQQQLKEKEENLSMAIASANLGTWYINAQTRDFFPSPRLKELFGFYPNENMPYEAAVDQIADSHRKKVTDAVEAAITKGEAYELEYPIIGFHDKVLRWVHATGKLYSNPANPEVSHFSGTIADITERKLDEQRRSDFIGMVSHELRNPLTAIKGYSYLIKKTAAKNNNEMLVSSIAKVENQVKRMEALISGFLEVARLGEGKIRLNRTQFDMADLVRIAEDESLSTITSHEVVFAPVDFTLVEADQDKIEQVLINFINNAVKYSPDGSIIKVACITKDSMAYISVTDQGMGIPEKDQPFIFDRFYRVESEDMKNKKGFGIGLYICKEIIERHSGQIGVESMKSKGSTFWFTLPILNGN